MQHGSKIDVKIQGATSEATINFNYLQMPLMVKYGFGDMDGANFYVQGGPYLGLGIGKVKTKFCMDGKCEEIEQAYGDGDGEVINPDFGLQLGAGVNLNSKMSFDARYILGLADFNSDGDVKTKHKGINVSVGYTF
ncbi:MAG: PorT family protein [Saprospiraceae bacterium]|nr:PorT family protein [Saprospiraceae bacterium]